MSNLQPHTRPSAYHVRDSNIHGKTPSVLKWNYDGSILASSSSDEKKTILSSLDSSGSLRNFQVVVTQPTVNAIVWSPTDMKRFAVIGKDKYVELWDVRQSTPTNKIPIKQGENEHAAFSPDGKYLTVSSYDKTFAVVDIQQGCRIEQNIVLAYQV